MKISRESVQNDFIRDIEELSGQNLLACYQCGKCSAGCPMIEHMDILPSLIIRLLQMGAEKEVLDSETIWVCASCLQCMAKCPKGVDLAKIMEALRTYLRRRGIDKVEITKIADEMWKHLPQQALVSVYRKLSP
jgi:heterodisulfide reductase subunit C